jgi:hypothetical protein
MPQAPVIESGGILNSTGSGSSVCFSIDQKVKKIFLAINFRRLSPPKV